MNLSSYQADVRDLLRDDNGQFYSTAKINRYINRARYQVALQTGCIRVLAAGAAAAGSDSTVGIGTAGGMIPGQVGNANDLSTSVFSTIAGQERYPYSFANSFVQSQNAGVKGVVDVYNVAVSWGGNKPAMSWMPWQDLQAYARSITNGTTSYPVVFSKYQEGESGQVWLFPVPSIATEMEWDCSCVPEPLVNDTTPEAIPQPYTNAVRFYAAKLAYFSSQRFGMADIMEEEFQKHMMTDAAAVNTGAVPNYYYADDSW